MRHHAVFIYARMDSRRLPGKVLKKFAGQSVIEIVLKRARCVGAETCALVTTTRSIDDELAAFGRNQGVTVIRGDVNDLVKRSLQALEETGATHFLRVNADSPLFSPVLAHRAMVQIGSAAMVSNLFERTFPYGVSVEWVAAELYRAMSQKVEEWEREHVTVHLYRQRKDFPAISMKQSRDDSALKLTLDTYEDYGRLSSLIGSNFPVDAEYWDVCHLPAPIISLALEGNSPND